MLDTKRKSINMWVKKKRKLVAIYETVTGASSRGIQQLGLGTSLSADDIDVVYNADQTSVFFEYIPTSTIQKKGIHWTKDAVECAKDLDMVLMKVPPGRAWVDDLQRQLDEANGRAFKLTPPDHKKVIG
ncbi:uncharacterized protein PITG_10072 [Phytophthora infestans T30-4]|uniref:Uncharacterized protein n=1 Tax=Phytophthora infestans (strain T30-4) TaxID=403677 RepID=D0NE86_PHYIT|nr:uncharacterized protein PITG_10072 [Phytophthora infestans T30-4]EEY56531.1 hypothetical protein PITG_10072 [Phytophthora infestans T30-4]|eukprot:XP_002902605.1 hypothetical protein PITG_10072 [Phytophthora infestans T30-4]